MTLHYTSDNDMGCFVVYPFIAHDDVLDTTIDGQRNFFSRRVPTRSLSSLVG